MILSITGHRPDKLGGWAIPNKWYDALMQALDLTLLHIRPDLVITGMALGVDQWVAELCILNDIPFLAAIPCEGQDSIWPPHSREKYHWILKHANSIKIISKGSYSPEKMHVRNIWMLDNSDKLLAIWDGSKGGTGSCVNAAKARGKEIFFLKLPEGIPKPQPKYQKAIIEQLSFEELNSILTEIQNSKPGSQTTISPKYKAPKPSSEEEKEEVEVNVYKRFVDLS